MPLHCGKYWQFLAANFSHIFKFSRPKRHKNLKFVELQNSWKFLQIFYESKSGHFAHCAVGAEIAEIFLRPKIDWCVFISLAFLHLKWNNHSNFWKMHKSRIWLHTWSSYRIFCTGAKSLKVLFFPTSK